MRALNLYYLFSFSAEYIFLVRYQCGHWRLSVEREAAIDSEVRLTVELSTGGVHCLYYSASRFDLEKEENRSIESVDRKSVV